MTAFAGARRPRLLGKLLGVNVLVLGVVALAIWLAIDYLAAGYFATLMERYGISPTEAHGMFLDSVHRYLATAALAAAALAVVASFLLTRRILGPLAQMTHVAGRLAAGDFSTRVKADTRDELGELGEAFNRMAEGLERLERLRKDLVADVAHELRTPLTNVRGYLEGLHDGVVPASGETFDLLLGEVRRLGALVEDLLQLAKADAARAFLAKAPFSLRELAEQVLEASRPATAARPAPVAVEVAANADRVVADRDRVAQVLRNLVDNALRHTPPGGRIELSATRAPGGVRVAVANTGPGIPAADLPRIFERFFVVDRSRSRAGGGSGLGLAIVRELVEAHGGSVGAESADGLTTVWFVLPS